MTEVQSRYVLAQHLCVLIRALRKTVSEASYDEAFLVKVAHKPR